MEVELRRLLESEKPPPSSSLTTEEAKTISVALAELAKAVREALPLLLVGKTKPKEESIYSASWLLGLCKSIPSELEPIHLARSILEAADHTDETQQQAALFDALGASEEAMQVLMEVAPVLNEIRQNIQPLDLEALANNGIDDISQAVPIDLEEEKRQLLLREAVDAAQIAAIAQAEFEEMIGGGTLAGSSSTTTHTVLRESEIRAKKFAEKAAKRAQQALQRAKEAGAIVDENDLLHIDPTHLGSGGLANRSEQEIWALRQSLLPEGTRQYYDQRGLPRDAIQIEENGMIKVIIPAQKMNRNVENDRLKIAEVLDPDLARAFAGTNSLNPMQSATFEVAFQSRDNMLVCAPTGAGKTNVAMLTVVAHFRDVGLLGQSDSSKSIDTGKKVVYIAPMKALAQEVVEKFSSKLKPMGIIVRELSGDMQLTRAEAESANVIVTTPEKWDVVTRKSGNDDNSLGNKCGLLIIDEVHLLADERGAVIESVVARLHRLVESRQRQVRIVALSATLPNYDDVANFLQVPDNGVLFFGPEHRPVPLEQTFIGVQVNPRDRNAKEKRMNEICFDVVVDSLRRGHQVMVFVHSRKGTGDTAKALADMASQEGVLDHLFITRGKEDLHGDAYKKYVDRVKKSRNREVGAHFENGMGIHHAGMLRGDRKLTEQMFNDGAIKVLCCTATLAWGINLPCHSVIIKGTEVYNPEKGGTVDLSILDVQQIFGRAGRPQFDTSGEATLITTHDAFSRYMDKLVRPVPIESNFVKQLADHLNAEVVGGTVTNLDEASRWLTYTYLYIRMLRNPLAYGISEDQKADDPMLRGRCLDLVTQAAKTLQRTKMLGFHEQTGNLSVSDNGRIAAHFYIQAESIATFTELFDRKDQLGHDVDDTDLFRLVCSACEFQQVKLRQEELDELQKLAVDTCPLQLHGAGTDKMGRNLITDGTDKCFVLLQAYISRAKIKSFTLISDTNYIAANAGRIARALFEMRLKKKRSGEALKLLCIANAVDKQLWWFRSPLRHFEDEFPEAVHSCLETSSFKRRRYDSFETVLSLLDMLPEEVGQLCRSKKQVGEKIQRFVRILPRLEVECTVKPITSNILRFRVMCFSDFEWHGRWHGGAQMFWLWVEGEDGYSILHHENIIITKQTYSEPIALEFSIPLFNAATTHYAIRVVADCWVGIDNFFLVSLREIEKPRDITPTTALLDLTPLPVSALNDSRYEKLYSKFKSFNPVQTQLFHVLYHTDLPVLCGSPTGSGKTMLAELAILRMKRVNPKGICVYIAPLKALARERLKEWRGRLGSPPLNWTILELSGDTSIDQSVLRRADILVCTPEKWDLVSRGWQNRKEIVFAVQLLVIDEVHLLGEERGAVLEAIVSRTRFISKLLVNQQHQQNGSSSNLPVAEKTRIIGLTTRLANPIDLADWIGIDTKNFGTSKMKGLYNFNHSVRPVPTKIHVQGYSGKHYCPRMATMNKPIFNAVKILSPNKPVLIFVASRRQTRLTALDMISYAASDDNPKAFLGCSEIYIESVAEKLSDEALRHTITFGIGLHHAGLSSFDRETVEKMFLKGEIQVVVATATLAWGVNLPAHLVIVKGTEYFDGKTSRYVDYPLTDVLQMIGRAGRPGFDTEAKAVVMVQDEKKLFYMKFLHQPFPVESCLELRMNENLNAEIASGTIKSLIEAVGYLTWTFYSRRVRSNPAYYGAESGSEDHVEAHLLSVAKRTLSSLRSFGCIRMESEDVDAAIYPTALGIAASQYYLVAQTPMQMQVGLREARKIILECLAEEGTGMDSPEPLRSSPILRPFVRSPRLDELSLSWLLFTVCSTHEFDELPVRHNEEFLNEELSDELMWGPDTSDLLAGRGKGSTYRNPEIYKDPHTKCFLLMQAYLERRSRLPISDYVNDTKSVVENIPRLLAAMSYLAYEDKDSTDGSFELLTQLSRVRQLFEARARVDDDPLLQLPGMNAGTVRRIRDMKKEGSSSSSSLWDVRSMKREDVSQWWLEGLSPKLSGFSVENAVSALYEIPSIALLEASVSYETTGDQKRIGKLTIVLEIQRTAQGSNKKHRQRRNHDTDDDTDTDACSHTLTILVGSSNPKNRLLGHDTVRMSRFGTWSIRRDIVFQDGFVMSNDDDFIVVRLLREEIRGMDTEVWIPCSK